MAKPKKTNNRPREPRGVYKRKHGGWQGIGQPELRSLRKQEKRLFRSEQEKYRSLAQRPGSGVQLVAKLRLQFYVEVYRVLESGQKRKLLFLIPASNRVLDLQAFSAMIGVAPRDVLKGLRDV